MFLRKQGILNDFMVLSKLRGNLMAQLTTQIPPPHPMEIQLQHTSQCGKIGSYLKQVSSRWSLNEGSSHWHEDINSWDTEEVDWTGLAEGGNDQVSSLRC